MNNYNNLILFAVLGIGIYFIFFQKNNLNKVEKNADTKPKKDCGCNKSKEPVIAPEL
jgi:hypothetical protein